MSTKTKEAAKTALAFALAYGLALKTGWMSPVWVGLTVVVIALPTAGQSLQKGVLRLSGTVPGCIAALVIVGLAPQSRWLALALTCAWMFFTTYMMLARPSKSYLWNVAGFTALIIMTGAFESPADVFDRASTRTVATVVGILIYTLVTTFLWPQSNAGAIRKALEQLLGTQRERFNALRAHPSDPGNDSELRELQLREVQQLAALGQALQAEGSESYQVREIRPELERLRDLCAQILDCLDRLETSVPTKGALRAAFPTVNPFLDEIDARFASMTALLTNEDAPRTPVEVSLSSDREALAELTPLDRAAAVVARGQLASLDVLTVETIESMEALVARPAERSRPDACQTQRTRAKALPGYDLDHLRGATLVAATVVAGFCLWVFVNPPGHASWVMLPPIVAMMVAGRQQLSAKVFIGPTAIALALGITIYAFVLPRLSTFAELGVVLFAAMFAVNYFTQGIGQFAGMVGVLMGISVQHHQAYSFAAMANNYLFTLGAFVLVYAMSYMIQSPRPEKAVLYLVRRFFRSAGFLVASTSGERSGRRGWFSRWRIAWHRRELNGLPDKIQAWSKAIDYWAFPSTAPDRDDALVVRMRAVANRIDELLESRAPMSPRSFALVLADEIRAWRIRLESTLADWSSNPDSPAAEALGDHLLEWRAELEARIESLGAGDRELSLGDDELRRFYALLGGYRGVSGTLLA
ncbi:MAG: FUSC family protein [Myxococcales bacterium]|nr:MAG: FUSC family protein [Myxococcales bacterium]